MSLLSQENLQTSYDSYKISRLSSCAPFFNISPIDIPIIYLHLSGNYVIAGNALSGEIILEVPVMLHESELILSSEGKEELRIFKSLKLAHDQKSKVYSFSVVLRYWQEIQPGNYKIPFLFKIPAFSPASFFYAGENQDKCYIKSEIAYFLNCKFKCAEGETEYLLPLNVRSQHSLSNPNKEDEMREVINKCFCCSAGITVFYLKVLNKEHCAANGTLQYRLLVNNNRCNLSIEKITSQVVREMSFQDKERIIEIRKITNKINRMAYVPANSSDVNHDEFVFLHDIKADFEGTNAGSTESVLIKCGFWLEIFVFYRSKLKKQPVKIKCKFHVDPITILYKDELEKSLTLGTIYEELPPVNIFIED